MNIQLRIDMAEIFNRTQNSDLARIADFIARKSTYCGGFIQEGQHQYESLLDAKSVLLRDLNVFLSGYGMKVYADRDSYSSPVIRFCTDEHRSFMVLEQIENQLFIN